MLQLVRNHSPFTVIILFIYCLLLHLPGLLHPLPPAAGPVVYNALLRIPDALFHHNAFCYSLLSVWMMFLQGIYLNHITSRHRLYLHDTYVPLWAYVSLTALLPAGTLFSPPLLALWPLLVAVRMILTLPQPSSPRANIFNTGFLLSIAALLFFPAIGFLLLLIIALLLLRPLNAGEWTVGALGYFTPLYFISGLLFLTGDLAKLKFWPELGVSLPRQLSDPLYLSVSIGVVIVVIWSGLYALQGALGRYVIAITSRLERCCSSPDNRCDSRRFYALEPARRVAHAIANDRAGGGFAGGE